MNNYKNIINTIGRVLQINSILMLFPLIVAIIYQEPFETTIVAFASASIGTLMNILKPNSHQILPRKSFIIVSLSWLLMALFGAVPLMISGCVPNFFDAFFEMSSRFTTTGSSILTNVAAMPKSILFWRSLSHWIGGMGVIVFILAVLPDNKEGSNMHILRAESPGPQVGKLVSKISATARILYLIYMALTVIEFLLLYLGPDPKMDLFSSITLSFGTAGTGGFAVLNASLASYSPYSQYVIGIFLMIFGTNFTLFYLLLIGKFKSVFKNEELRLYLGTIVISVVIIVISLWTNRIYPTFEECFRHSFLQVTSIISTAGFSTTDYCGATQWPTICLMVILFITFTGACAGSTGGGFKLSRVNILFKSIIRSIKNMVNPRKVELIKDSGSIVDDDVVKGAQNFFIVYILILFVSTFLISFDGKDLVTNFTASLTCISNVGPGLGNIVGPAGNFSSFSNFSKFVLSLTMITGRLEIFPMLALFDYKAWKTR